MVKVHYQESMTDPMGEYTVLLREVLFGQAGMSYIFFYMV